MKVSASEFITVRGLRYHVRHWGEQTAPKVFMLHGWMDVSASFQFMVDYLRRDWHVIAPDWRGFGLTDKTLGDCYWFPDYLGDLDAILRHYSPNVPVNLLGHSMGGNAACVYAGVRSARIRRLINLEGFGLPATQPRQAPARFAQWLDELQNPPTLMKYASRQEVIGRLRKNNSRLTQERAEFLSLHWATENAQGEWEILGDPMHKSVNPYLYRLDEILACWEMIAAPVLWLEANDTNVWSRFGNKEKAQAEMERRLSYIPHVRKVTIPDAGHMLHHDQPEAIAALVEEFLA